MKKIERIWGKGVFAMLAKRFRSGSDCELGSR